MSWLCRFWLHKWIGSPASLNEVCARCGKARRRRPSGDAAGNPGFLIWK